MSTSVAARLRGMADDNREMSLSHRLRERRFQRFDELANTLPKPLSVIDIGGTSEFWEQRGWAGRDDVSVTLVNLKEQEDTHSNIHSTVADAADLAEHEDGCFDIAFSNSVIEHLFTFDRQQAMAREVRRVARAYWVQTPNFWFPFEPHFLCPAWHWLPVAVRVAVIRRRAVGWNGRCPDPEVANRVVREVRLLRRRELRGMFPEATLVPERFGGLVKSWTAIAGFPDEGTPA